MLNYAKAGLAGLALLSSAEVSLPLCCTNAPDTQIRQNNSLFPPLAIVWWLEACVSHDAVLLLLVDEACVVHRVLLHTRARGLGSLRI